MGNEYLYFFKIFVDGINFFVGSDKIQLIFFFFNLYLFINKFFKRYEVVVTSSTK